MGNLSPMSQEEESATKDTTESSEIVNSDSSTMAKAVSPRLTKDTTESSEIVNSDSSTMAKAVSPRLTKDTTESSEALIFIEDSKLMRILCIQVAELMVLMNGCGWVGGWREGMGVCVGGWMTE